MVGQSRPLDKSRKRILSAVFPVSAQISTQPTPQATPDTQFAAPGQPFGGFHDGPVSSLDELPSDPVARQIAWERAWHSATSFLRLPADLVSIHGQLEIDDLERNWLKKHPLDSPYAVKHLLRLGSGLSAPDDGPHDEPLLAWYGNEVRRHFLTLIRPRLHSGLQRGESEEALYDAMQLLQDARTNYFFPLSRYVFPVLKELHDEASNRAKALPRARSLSKLEARFKKDLNALIINSTPQHKFEQLLGSVLTREVGTILGLVHVTDDTNTDEQAMMLDVEDATGAPVNPSMLPPKRRASEKSGAEDAGAKVHAARMKVLQIFKALENIGLGGARSQRVFAEAMNEAMNRYVIGTFADQWQAPSTVIMRIRDWVENHFARLIVEVLHAAGRTEELEHARLPPPMVDGRTELVTFEEMDRWREMCIGRLGRLRIAQLFDIVVEWEASKGAVQDLKAYSGTPAKRNHIIMSFTSVLSQRLLHPGASTTEILQIYISLIRVFALLDPKGVLIDRVARPIRSYLRERDDTVKVIVNGLLADVNDGVGGEERAPDNGDVLVDLAVELHQASARAAHGGDDHDFDWDDMHWTPEPIDAGPDYHKSRSADVIGSVMSLFESKDVLIKEFQRIIGERLLKSNASFEQEIRVLELLKLRFGEGSLQASEVMLRDVQESRVLDRNIREDQDFPLQNSARRGPTDGAQREQSLGPQLHAKILSRLFWPQLHEESFALPEEIAALQGRFERGFENLKPSRKLTWLYALGQVTVELELDDRTVLEEVTTWQASVIHAFHDPTAEPQSRQTTRTVMQLVDTLKMDESLVRNGLRFWAAKRVLFEVTKDAFAVLERLDQAKGGSEDGNSGVPGEGAVAFGVSGDVQGEDIALFRSGEDVAKEKLQMYWQFIVGMLTNGGPMPLPQIAMMLNFAVAGGFPHGEEELREYLNVMVQESRLEFLGGRYKIKP